MEVTFSIIMPVYNVEKYVEESIESTLNQTYSSFELLIINDGSTDNSRLIAEKYSLKDQRVKIFDKENGGASSARNIGLDHAVGKYIYFMDSDDTLQCNMLEKLKKEIDDNEPEIIAFTATPFFDKNFLNKKDEILEASYTYYGRDFLDEGNFTGRKYYELTAPKKRFVASVCLYVVKRLLIEESNLKFHEGIILEDELFSRQILFNAKSIYFIKQKLYNRRIRENSVSTSSNILFKILSLITIAEEIEKMNKNISNDLLNKDVEILFSRAIRYLDDYPGTSEEYKTLLKRFFSSFLLKSHPLLLTQRMDLKYKNVKRMRLQLLKSLNLFTLCSDLKKRFLK